MPITNHGNSLGNKTERVSFKIEETDFLIKTLSEVSITVGQAKLAASVIDKLMVLHKRLMDKVTEV